MMMTCSDLDVDVAAVSGPVDDDGRVLPPRAVRGAVPAAGRGAGGSTSRLRSHEGRRMRENQLRLRRMLRRRAGRAARPLHRAAPVRAGRRRADVRQPATVQRRAQQLPRSRLHMSAGSVCISSHALK